MSIQNNVLVIVQANDDIKIEINLKKNGLTFSNILKIMEDREPDYDFYLKKSTATLDENSRRVVKYDKDRDIWVDSDGEDIKDLDISKLELIVNAIPKAKETPSSKFEPYLKEASLLSAEAYKLGSNETYLIDTLKKQYHFSSIHIGRHSKQRFVIAKSGISNTIYLSIPGTANAEDVYTDLAFLHTKDCFGDCRVHSGFYERAKSIPIIAIYNHLYTLFKEKKEKFNFIICGHSLGGAIAQILTTVLLIHLHRTNSIDEEIVDIYSISFGAPYWVNRSHLEENIIGPRRRMLKDFLINVFVEDDPIVHILNFEIISRLDATNAEHKKSLNNVAAGVKGSSIESITKVTTNLVAGVPDFVMALGLDKLVLAAAKELAFYVPIGRYFSFENNTLKEFSPIELNKSIEYVSKRSLGDVLAIHGIENYRNRVANLFIVNSNNIMNQAKGAAKVLFGSPSTTSQSLGVDANICFDNKCLVEVFDTKEKNEKRITAMFDTCATPIINVEIKYLNEKGKEDWKELTPCRGYYDYPIENTNKTRVTFERIEKDLNIDFTKCSCEIRVTSPFRQVHIKSEIHRSLFSDEHSFSTRQIQTAWFFLMTCSEQEFNSPENNILRTYLESLEKIFSATVNAGPKTSRFKNSWEKRNELSQNAIKFMNECKDIRSYSIVIAGGLINEDLDLVTNAQVARRIWKKTAAYAGGLLLLTAIGLSIGAVVVAAEAASAAASTAAASTAVAEGLGIAGGTVAGASLVSFAGSYAIKKVDKAIAEAYHQKLIDLIEIFGGNRPLINDVAQLEDILSRTIFGHGEYDEDPQLQEVITKVKTFKFKEDYCDATLKKLRLITEGFIILRYIRASLRQYKFITVLGKKNTGKTTFLKRFFEFHNLNDAAGTLKTGVDTEGATRCCTSYVIPRKNNTKLCVIDTPGVGDVSQIASVLDGKRASIFFHISLHLDCMVIVTFGKSYEVDTGVSLAILTQQQPKEYCIFGNQIDNCLDEIERSYPQIETMKDKLDAHKTSIVKNYNNLLEKENEGYRDFDYVSILVEKFHFSSFLPLEELQAEQNTSSSNASQEILYLDANKAISMCLILIQEESKS